jgi:non-canonical purine NTP pyrophosphatase (RdgB/HAM1 family)
MFDGYVRGKIVKPRGTSGFGWDSIFDEETTGKTFAEMTLAEKNQQSHRARAFEKMVTFLHSL